MLRSDLAVEPPFFSRLWQRCKVGYQPSSSRGAVMYLESVVSFACRVCVSTLITWITVAGGVGSGNRLRAQELRVPIEVVASGGRADTRIEYRSRQSALAGLQL